MGLLPVLVVIAWFLVPIFVAEHIGSEKGRTDGAVDDSSHIMHSDADAFRHPPSGKGVDTGAHRGDHEREKRRSDN